MSYEVIKTIKGIDYRYLQETYREGGRVKTRNVYLGPVEPRRRKGVTGFLQDLVSNKREGMETASEMDARQVREDAERAQTERVNELLTGDSITLSEVSEVADIQSSDGNESEGPSDGPSEGTDSSDSSDASEGGDDAGAD